jgi:hypothetical protein
MTFVREPGLQPSPPPEVVPEISEDDLRVCWLAISPIPT